MGPDRCQGGGRCSESVASPGEPRQGAALRFGDGVTPAEFIGKWSDATLRERQGSQEHFLDLCRLPGQPTPAEEDLHGDRYCFERGATKRSPRTVPTDHLATLSSIHRSNLGRS